MSIYTKTHHSSGDYGDNKSQYLHNNHEYIYAHTIRTISKSPETLHQMTRRAFWHHKNLIIIYVINTHFPMQRGAISCCARLSTRAGLSSPKPRDDISHMCATQMAALAALRECTWPIISTTRTTHKGRIYMINVCSGCAN